MGDPKAKARAADATVHLLLVSVAIVSLFPVAWMMLIALKPVTHSVTGWSALVSPALTLANVRRIFELIPFWQNAMNSAVSNAGRHGPCALF